MVMVYHSEKIQDKISKGASAKSGGNQEQASKGFLPVESPKTHNSSCYKL